MITGDIFITAMMCVFVNSLEYKYKVCMCVHTEIEMVVMEKCKVSELTEQNITDEEKTAAATRTHSQRSRYMHAHTTH